MGVPFQALVGRSTPRHVAACTLLEETKVINIVALPCNRVLFSGPNFYGCVHSMMARASLFLKEPRKRRAHKLKRNAPDTPPGVLGHPAGQTGVYRPVSQGGPVIWC